jgi:hypothetical protein
MGKSYKCPILTIHKRQNTTNPSPLDCEKASRPMFFCLFQACNLLET